MSHLSAKNILLFLANGGVGPVVLGGQLEERAHSFGTGMHYPMLSF